LRPGLAVLKKIKISCGCQEMNQDLSFVQPVAQSPREVSVADLLFRDRGKLVKLVRNKEYYKQMKARDGRKSRSQKEQYG
jgi:hypothetical protein